METKPANRPGLTIILLFLVFAAPMVGGWLLYLNSQDADTAHTTAHGTLFDPARPLPEAQLAGSDGTPMTTASLRGRWTLVYLGPSACEASCRDNLHKIRQVHLALGEDMNRVGRLWLIPDARQGERPPAVPADHAGLQAVAAQGASARDFVRQFRFPSSGDAPSVGVYIVDPLGNLVMFYDSTAPAKGILRDMERLLKVSRIG